MTSSGHAIVWGGRLADETDENLLPTLTTIGDRDLTYVEIPSREEASRAEPPFRNVLIRHYFGVEPHTHLPMQCFWQLKLSYPAEVSCLFSIEAPPEEIASIDQTLESLIEEIERKDVSTNEYRPIEIDIEHDIVVQIPPLKRRSVKVRVTSIRRAEPHVVYYPMLDE